MQHIFPPQKLFFYYYQKLILEYLGRTGINACATYCKILKIGPGVKYCSSQTICYKQIDRALL